MREVRTHRQFRIDLEDGCYVAVVVAKTEKTMRRIECRVPGKFGMNKKQRNKKYIARTIQWFRGKELARVFFCKKWVGSGTVTHEMYHVAHHAAKRLRLSEEDAALLIERLVKVFWIEWRREKFANKVYA